MIFVVCAATAIALPAQTFTNLLNFDGYDGSNPEAGLIQATDGNFYGTTYYGGANAYGTVFKTSPTGTLTTLYNFCSQSNCTDGYSPFAGLIQATDGNFYGTTEFGGASSSACSNSSSIGCGTVFRITPTGSLTTLYSFCSQTNCADGAYPEAGLIQAADGNFYGTTYYGGGHNDGTVFKITPKGTLTTLHRFVGSDGNGPLAGLVQGTDRNFYGTTWGGGDGCGTIFTITPSGELTALYMFDCTDGGDPVAGLVQATDGNFYGTTLFGGDFGGGCDPNYGCGTVFKLSVGLGRFVETNPTSGKVGSKVVILGNQLKGTTRVAFNGTAARFTVVSSTEIKTSVPTGATTGIVTVTTPKGKLKSNVVFRVTK
jgi:uncharacterized repeat protein (TIGR03803 family)